jgi:hypothetical protein
LSKSFHTSFIAYEEATDGGGKDSSPISDINSISEVISNKEVMAKFIYNIPTGNKQEYLNNCFIDIKTLLDKNSHDYGLQYKIERYLFESKIYFNETNIASTQTNISFSQETSEWIISKKETIIQYLEKMVNEENSSKKSKASLLAQNLNYTVNLLKILTPNKVSDLLISFFVWLVSNEHNKEGLNQMDCYTTLGNKLVNLYTYELYNRYKKKKGCVEVRSLSRGILAPVREPRQLNFSLAYL